jgi:hypothetical protein
MLVATIAVLIAGLALYWLGNRPQATRLEAAPWPIKSRDAAILHGIGPGQALISLDFRAPTAVTIDFSKGAVLDGKTLTGTVHSSVQSVKGETIAITVRSKGGNDDTVRHSVMIVAQSPDPRLSGFAVKAMDVPLEFDAVLVPAEGSASHGSVVVDPPFDNLETFAATIPPGAGMSVNFLHQPDGALLIDAGNIDDEHQSARLAISALEVGRELPSGVERTSFACGKPIDAIKWGSLGPKVEMEDCEANRLWLTGIDVKNGATFVLEGSGYTELKGNAHLWTGFANLMKNDIIKALVGVFVAGLIGWMTTVLRQRFWSS